jgi:hypothetical protein
MGIRATGLMPLSWFVFFHYFVINSAIEISFPVSWEKGSFLGSTLVDQGFCG